MRRRACVGALLPLAALVAILAPSASASKWGGDPSVGRWSGRTDGQSAKFRVTSGGTEVRDFVLHVPYSCVSAATGRPGSGGTFVFRWAGPLPVDPNTGWTKIARVRLMVPGAKRSYPGAISGLFTSHHPIPPPARDAEFSINGAFARGEDECRLGREGEVRWALHADR